MTNKDDINLQEESQEYGLKLIVPPKYRRSDCCLMCMNKSKLGDGYLWCNTYQCMVKQYTICDNYMIDGEE